MTPLRQRMLEDMQLRGFSARTQEAYIHSVRQLAVHFHKPPDQLIEDDLRQYFLYLANVKYFARTSFTIALCGLKFFYERTLGREWQVLDLVRPAREQKLPVILSRDEVHRILGYVRLPVYRACVTTIYVCGLRLLGEPASRSPTWTAPGGSCTFMARAGATATSRCRWTRCGCSGSTGVPAAPPSGCCPPRSAEARATSSPRARVQSRARVSSPPSAGPSSRATSTSERTFHTLRHSYATQLLEAGVNLRLIQSYLSHTSARTTQVYTHLTPEVCQQSQPESPGLCLECARRAHLGQDRQM